MIHGRHTTAKMITSSTNPSVPTLIATGIKTEFFNSGVHVGEWKTVVVVSCDLVVDVVTDAVVVVGETSHLPTMFRVKLTGTRSAAYGEITEEKNGEGRKNTGTLLNNLWSVTLVGACKKRQAQYVPMHIGSKVRRKINPIHQFMTDYTTKYCLPSHQLAHTHRNMHIHSALRMQVSMSTYILENYSKLEEIFYRSSQLD